MLRMGDDGSIHTPSTQAMSEEQLKAAAAEATAEQEEGSGEEVSEDDLAGVAGGSARMVPVVSSQHGGLVGAYCPD